MQKNIIRLLPGVIIIIGIILRLWRLPEVFHFTYDEEVFAFIGKRMFVNGHIPLIGGVTPMHVHLAPYFYWLSGIFLWFSKLNPLGWGYAAVLISCITMILLFVTTQKIYGRTVAIIALFIYCISFYQNVFDRHYWGLVFDGLISVGVMFSIFNIINLKTKYVYLLSLLLAFGINTDPSMIVLILLSIISLFYFKPKINFKIYLIALFIFLFSFLPLVIFDLRHNFSNIGGLKLYIEDIQATKNRTDQFSPIQSILFIPQALGRTLYTFGDQDLAKQYSYCQNHLIERLNNVPIPIVIIVLVSLVIFFIDKSTNSKERIGNILIKILFMSVILGILIYGIGFGGILYDHYLATLFPIYYIMVAYLLKKYLIKIPILFILLLSMFAILNINSSLNIKHSYGFTDKTSAVKWAIEKTGNNEFSLDVLSSCFRYNGYRYLFLLGGKEPVKSYVDANFTYLFDKPPAFEHPKYLILITNPDFVETKQYDDKLKIYQDHIIEKTKFGKIEVMYINNVGLEKYADY
ncbi:MAG: hypothetical protein UR52_C0001G0018 [Candidatus Gottesmanbacteria bacterium GW2011_GWA1_34_13]|uniref:Glycosyltransferase RgtA/B/C/D-like domain-containing protein n=1 Tax=Candidatus Gottesmanbacteria bacterium GW2011_GWA1_34_13 TaxID=1618434 RepID=A0A0G0ASA1_9BACT|nr:MAG: hypothetical protein UR52_C0001G0018 [Candidatus Gottesmanbacteria bacterium GW2011_GWA1_34_13]